MIYLDRPEIAEECGVFGVFAEGSEVSQIAFFGLLVELQYSNPSFLAKSDRV